MLRRLTSNFLFILFLGIVGSANCICSERDSLQDVIQLNELHLKEPSLGTTQPLVLIAAIKGRQKRLSREFVLEVVRTKLAQLGFRSTIYVGDYAEDLRLRKIHEKTLLSPKLTIEIDSQSDDRRSGYVSSCFMSLFEYSANSLDRTRFKAKRLWSREQDFKGDSQDEVEGNVIQFIQKELETLKFAYRQKKPSKSFIAQGAADGVGSVSNSSMSYSLRWNDPDNKRNRFLFGASAGTPAMGNLHFGFWGSRAIPIVIGISGMYFDTQHRGLQFDIGWAFDNSGSFKQVAGIAVVGLNETSKVVTYERDELGRVTGTTTEIIDGIRPYIGPAYTLDWNNFRFQAGIGLKAQEGNQSRVRALFQIGYTPPIGF